ncbi:helix-turn-helix domain-containing protein [Luteimonas sp. A534]
MRLWIALYAVGAVQAAMLAVALWRRPANAPANRVLSAWLAIVAADLAVKALHMASPGAGFAPAFGVARLLPFVYAPLFFVYVRSLTVGRAPGVRALVHGGWFLLVLSWAAWRWLSGDPLPVDGSWDAGWFDPLLFGVAFAYLAAAVLEIRRYRAWLRTRRADADRLSLRWLAVMAGCQFAIWGIAMAHWQLGLPFVDYRLIYVAVAAWVCVVGWFSQGQPPVVVAQADDAAPAGPDAPAADSALDDPRFDAVEARLSALMSEQAMFREPALTIAQLARRSGYPEYLVSTVINRRFGGNFWDYVNRHRIDAVRACLADAKDARSILEIAYDAGFTSKSTFNTAFKRIIGETPSGYRRRQASPAAAPPSR